MLIREGEGSVIDRWIFRTLSLIALGGLWTVPPLVLAGWSSPAAYAQSATGNAAQPSSVESNLLSEINRVRTAPREYADWLESLRSDYSGTVFRFPGAAPWQTMEGVAALDDAIATLRSLDPRPPLSYSAGMSLAAHDHATDLGAHGRTGTVGSDGSQVGDRLSRYGRWSGNAMEANTYGDDDPAMTVLLMVLSDGNPNRSMRQTILNPDFQTIGLGCAAHTTQRRVCVVNYASRYTDTVDLTTAVLSSTQPTPLVTPPAPQTAVQTVPQPVPTPSPAPTTVSDLPALEQAVIAETNRVRQNPAAYANELEALLPLFDDKLLHLPGEPPLLTDEGAAVVEEAIAQLRQTPPLPLLSPTIGMSEGARDHVHDIGPRGGLGHIGSDRSTPLERVLRYGTIPPGNSVAENIDYTPINDARWHVMQLIIDDGVANRGHRNTILNPDYRKIGVACGEHAEYGNMCVITYASDYLDQ